MKEPVYYYVRGNKKSVKRGVEYESHPPVITVCIAKSDVPGFFLRGVAICSAKDQFEKELIPMDAFGAHLFEEIYEDDKEIAECNIHGGRDWALRRVKRAERYLRKQCRLGVVPEVLLTGYDHINSGSKNIQAILKRFGLEEIPFTFKTNILSDQQLTDFEKKLLIKVQ